MCFTSNIQMSKYKQEDSASSGFFTTRMFFRLGWALKTVINSMTLKALYDYERDFKRSF